jgi:DNA-binding transcriptional LysR family regulator
MNWDDARVFVALHREKTLRAAARALDIDQATVGRRLAALEHALGATLFLRTSSGYELTPVGRIAIRAAEAMEQSAHDLVRHTQGVDKRFAGEVKLSTTDALAQEFVLPAIGSLHAKHPDVSVVLDTTTLVVNLGKREADTGKSGCSRRRTMCGAMVSHDRASGFPGMTSWFTSPISPVQRCQRSLGSR